jgi:hypothetical protein
MRLKMSTDLQCKQIFAFSQKKFFEKKFQELMGESTEMMKIPLFFDRMKNAYLSF